MAAEQHLAGIYYERERTPWYWRVLGTIAASLILLGFLFFPFAFPSSSVSPFNQSVFSVVAVALLALGYSLSVALWFLCRSWLFQLDVVFVPCLSSCLLGALNVVFNLCIRPAESAFWTAGVISALVLSIVSATAYAALSISCYTKLRHVRMRGLAPARDSEIPDYEGGNPHRKAFAQLLSSSTDVSSHHRSPSTHRVYMPESVDSRRPVAAESPTRQLSTYSAVSSMHSSRQHARCPESESSLESSSLATALKSARERALLRDRQQESAPLHPEPTEKPASESAGFPRQPQRFDFAVRAHSDDPEELDARMALPRDSMSESLPLSPQTPRDI